MPRKAKTRKKVKRGRKLKGWVKKTKVKQRGGFFFLPFLIAGGIAAAKAAAVGAVSAGAAYGTNQIIKQAGGRMRMKKRIYK